MNLALFFKRNTLAVAVLGISFALPAGAQEAAAGKVAENVYKNIQVLQGTPADRFDPTMRFFAVSLGVRCQFCHVGGDFASDTKPEKATARKMITMMREINKGNFNSRMEVTCYTCHSGHTEPIGTPILPGSEVLPPPPPTMPSVDDILSKYVTAIGGEQAIRKVTTRVISGTQDVPDGKPGSRATVPAEFEQYQKAPNLLSHDAHNQANAFVPGSLGFDGTTAWVTTEDGTIEDMVAPNQQRFKRTSNLLESVNLKQDYMRMAVRGIEKVNGKDAYVVLGNPSGDSAERLYFDTQTSLLVRKITVVATAGGNLPAEVDYDDYRDTGSGVKIPFTTRIIPSVQGESVATPSTIRVLKVQDNVAIEDAKFVRPPAKPAAR